MSSFNPSLTVEARRFFVTSDTHYAHANICRATSKWPVEDTRDFDSLEAMNDALVRGINSVVPRDGVLFHLGDWSFGGIDKIAEFRSRLHVETVHLIYGNHDHHLIKGKEQHHFASLADYREILVSGQPIVLMHYGMRVWNCSHKNAWHLFGHSHDALPPFGRSMDVGVDTHDYRPYSFEEIRQFMLTRQPVIVDHHGVREEVT